MSQESLFSQNKYNGTESTSLQEIIYRLKYKNNDNFWPNDFMWVQFVKDHKEIIKENSTTIVLHPNDLRKFKYGIESYLTEYNYPKSIGWIVLWLNQLDSNFNFDESLQTIMIPDINQLISLYSQYTTNKAYYKKNNGISNL